MELNKINRVGLPRELVSFIFTDIISEFVWLNARCVHKLTPGLTIEYLCYLYYIFSDINFSDATKDVFNIMLNRFKCSYSYYSRIPDSELVLCCDMYPKMDFVVFNYTEIVNDRLRCDDTYFKYTNITYNVKYKNKIWKVKIINEFVDNGCNVYENINIDMFSDGVLLYGTQGFFEYQLPPYVSTKYIKEIIDEI